MGLAGGFAEEEEGRENSERTKAALAAAMPGRRHSMTARHFRISHAVLLSVGAGWRVAETEGPGGRVI